MEWTYLLAAQKQLIHQLTNQYKSHNAVLVGARALHVNMPCTEAKRECDHSGGGP